MVETRSWVPATSSTVIRTVSPVAPVDRPGREPAEADLRPLQVGEDPDGAARAVRRLPHRAVDLLVVVVVAVAEVQPGDVHAGAHELRDPVRARRGRAERADDLGAPPGDVGSGRGGGAHADLRSTGGYVRGTPSPAGRRTRVRCCRGRMPGTGCRTRIIAMEEEPCRPGSRRDCGAWSAARSRGHHRERGGTVGRVAPAHASPARQASESDGRW